MASTPFLVLLKMLLPSTPIYMDMLSRFFFRKMEIKASSIVICFDLVGAGFEGGHHCSPGRLYVHTLLFISKERDI